MVETSRRATSGTYKHLAEGEHTIWMTSKRAFQALDCIFHGRRQQLCRTSRASKSITINPGSAPGNSITWYQLNPPVPSHNVLFTNQLRFSTSCIGKCCKVSSHLKLRYLHVVEVPSIILGSHPE